MLKDTHIQNQNNQVTISGKIASAPTFEYQAYGENFYSLKLNVNRLSDKADTIPVLFSDRLMKIAEQPEEMIGKLIRINGQFRSYNKYIVEKHRNSLELSVFAKEMTLLEEANEHENEISFRGFICKNPSYRKTPLGREITDVLIAVNRPYGKSAYIPCICWSRNAIYVKDLAVGTELVIKGRIQSRSYIKKHEDGTTEEKTAYEVSVSMLYEPEREIPQEEV